jgi:RHS repeat-associated protein
MQQPLADASASGQVVWYLTDNLGSVRDVIDSTGALLDHLDYSSFGQISAESNPAARPLFTYTGGLFDSATGLVRDGARLYDPRLGRFISQDPLSFAGGDANLYRYTGNDPINATDPSGYSTYDGSAASLDTNLGSVALVRSDGLAIAPFSEPADNADLGALGLSDEGAPSADITAQAVPLLRDGPGPEPLYNWDYASFTPPSSSWLSFTLSAQIGPVVKATLSKEGLKATFGLGKFAINYDKNGVALNSKFGPLSAEYGREGLALNLEKGPFAVGWGAHGGSLTVEDTTLGEEGIDFGHDFDLQVFGPYGGLSGSGALKPDSFSVSAGPYLGVPEVLTVGFQAHLNVPYGLGTLADYLSKFIY